MLVRQPNRALVATMLQRAASAVSLAVALSCGASPNASGPVRDASVADVSSAADSPTGTGADGGADTGADTRADAGVDSTIDDGSADARPHHDASDAAPGSDASGDGGSDSGVDAAVDACALFLPALTIDASAHFEHVVAADLNGDRIADMALTTAGSVSVFIGNGDGTFQPDIAYAAGTVLTQVAVEDLNGDGKPDLVAADATENDVVVWLGGGDGTFGSPTKYATGAQPYCLAVADLRGHGVKDIVACNSNLSGTVSVLLGRGDGTFQAQVTQRVGAQPVAVLAADLNGDGHADVVTANETGASVTVLLGRGDGALLGGVDYPTPIPGVFAVSSGDFNGDSILDLVVGGEGGWLLIGRGDGTFVSGPRPTLRDTYNVTPGDFNGDGVLDIALPWGYLGKSSALAEFGRGDGTFGAAQYFTVGLNPRWSASADFNGDGWPDLATADFGGFPSTLPTVSILLNSGQCWQGGSLDGGTDAHDSGGGG